MHRSHSKQCHSGAAHAGRSQWASARRAVFYFQWHRKQEEKGRDKKGSQEISNPLCPSFSPSPLSKATQHIGAGDRGSWEVILDAGAQGSSGRRTPVCLLGALPGKGQPPAQALFSVSLILPYLFYRRAVSLVSRHVCFGICSRLCCMFSQ